MKKVITLLLAAGLVIGAASAANAVDIKAKGLWHNAMSFADRNFEKHNGSDKMQNATRIRTQIDVIASESLKGVVYFEIGPQNWGKGADGASLGTDGKVVKVRYNYVDWVIPQTDAKVRMGLQNFSLPGFALPNVILGGGGADGAGITLSTQFTKNIGATLFWLRAENDNTDSATDYGKQYHYSDAMDFTGITLPLKFDGVVTPWPCMVCGPRQHNAGASVTRRNCCRAVASRREYKTLTGNSLTDRHGDAWWAGFTTELKVLDPFRFALDATYGRVDLGEGLSTKGKKIDVKREGWIVSALAEYKMESVTPGLTAWYSSGDDANVNNGSERLPTINPDVKVTSYGFDGTNFCRAQQVLGTSVDGTFGIVAH
ncbi:MAG: outer membrane homotrimeric porin, partial [Bilophila wadsworthia]